MDLPNDVEEIKSRTMLTDREGYVVSQANQIGQPSYYYYSKEIEEEKREDSPPRRRPPAKAVVVEDDDNKMPGTACDPKRKICFQNCNLMLTYSTHLQKDLY